MWRAFFIKNSFNKRTKIFLSLEMMAKSGLELILKFTKPLQRYLLSCHANSAYLGRYFCTGQQQLWRGSVNFKINSRPLSTIIFKLKNGNFMTRDFSPLIKRVLVGVMYMSRLVYVNYIKSVKIFRFSFWKIIRKKIILHKNQTPGINMQNGRQVI